MPFYLSAGILFTCLSYLLMRKRFRINTIVHSYLIITPIYMFYIMLAFWNVSVASFCWLLPIPLAAYIFFTRKVVVAYSIYTLFIIITGSIFANNFSFDFQVHSQKEVMFTDTLLIASNILVITLLIYYKDKIKKNEILSYYGKEKGKIQEEKKNNSENTLKEDNIDAGSMEKLFCRIEAYMSEDQPYKDVKFNLSSLSVAIGINSNYISKAIRYKGYSNFSIYLNMYRINYIKELFTEVDFQKTTLMYVYSEAGFSNQSTFNRVFKQIEGTTPSEYLQKNIKPADESNIEKQYL